MRDKDLRFEFIKGNKHAGGTHRNCTNSCVRVTHIPTGLQVTVDERNQIQNKKKAVRLLKKKVQDAEEERKACLRKSERDKKIKEKKYIRTYNFKRKEVVDHRNGKRAALDRVLNGELELLYSKNWK